MRLRYLLVKYRVRLMIGLTILALYISGLSYIHLSRSGSGRPWDEDMEMTVRGPLPRGLAVDLSDHFYQPRKSLLQNSKPFVKTCQEHTNFVFIKCMKCATETMGTILRRFGLMRNLSFVVPVGKKLYLGWPLPLTSRDYRPSKGGGFNLLVEHAIYNRTVMRAMMPADTKYFTIIRQPYSHFKSVFNYFNIANLAKVPGSDPISVYLHDLEKYEEIYKSSESAPIRYCVPDNFSMTRNLMSHCLGMPLGFPAGRPDIRDSPTAVERYIRDLDREFSLVMIVEYFIESLVLLRRLMCWTIKDVLYHSVNRQNYLYKKALPKPENVAIYSKWSHVDYLLYDHFNRTFWRKIEQAGEDFKDEVYFLYQVETRMELYCFGSNPDSDLDPDRPPLQVEASPWSEAFEFSADVDCGLMKLHLFEAIKQEYDRL